MAYTTNENEGSLFTQENKKTVKHPDKTGRCKVAGIEYWVSGWDTIAKESGMEYLKLKFSPVEKKEEISPQQTIDPNTPF